MPLGMVAVLCGAMLGSIMCCTACEPCTYAALASAGGPTMSPTAYTCGTTV